MFALTTAERRGALLLLLCIALGAAWDLLHLRAVPAPPADDALPADAASPAPGAISPGTGADPGAAAPTAAAPLDLNAADARQLDALPGIGPVLAGRIVAYRSVAGPFRSPRELLAVRGIGPRLLARLEPLVVAGRAGRTRPPGPVRNARSSRR